MAIVPQSTADCRQYKPSTLKVYEEARRSFENLMLKKAEQATIQDVETWLHNLRAIGHPTSTCRTYLSAINHLAGLKVRPRGFSRESVEQVVLSHEQIKKMLFAMNTQDRLLFLCVLVYGPEARIWTWQIVMEYGLDLPPVMWNAIDEYLKERGLGALPRTLPSKPLHWIGGPALNEAVFRISRYWCPITTQEVNRRLKKYARWVGIGPAKISLGIWARSGKELLSGRQYEVGEALGLPLPRPLPKSKNDLERGVTAKRDPRLHGIGRRTSSSMIRVARKP